MSTPASSTYTGWWDDKENSRLDYYYRGTKVGHMNATTFVLAASVGLTVTDTGLTVTAGGLTVTSGGAIVTAGDLVVTAGDAQVLAENLYMGAATAFGTTEPTSAVIFKAGTAPSGTITTSCAAYTDGTVLKKIIAANTISNIET